MKNKKELSAWADGDRLEYNLQSEMRKIAYDYITKTSCLPKHIKPQAIQIVGNHISTIGLELGALELLWRRENNEGDK